MKVPPCMKVWNEMFPNTIIPWTQIWKIKSFYATPRDIFAWLKAMHKNLYLNDHNGETCSECNQHEDIRHLVNCATNKKLLWDPLEKLMISMGFDVPTGATDKELFWLLGRISDTEAVTQEQAGIMFIAWRALYAELVDAKKDKHRALIAHAYHRTIQLTISRLKAHGERWKDWCILNRKTSKKSIIPLDKRDRKVITHTPEGTYTINQKLFDEHKLTKKNNRAYKPPQTPAPPPATNQTTQTLAIRALPQQPTLTIQPPQLAQQPAPRPGYWTENLPTTATTTANLTQSRLQAYLLPAPRPAA